MITANIKFIIIGAERAGTTSLYNYIMSHTELQKGKNKETEFFDREFKRGTAWYNDQFPLQSATGEATPSYYYSPLAADRIKKYLPDVQLIMVMRNPIELTQSKYWQQWKRGDEYIPEFNMAIQVEKCRIRGEYKKILHDEDGTLFRRFAYLERGKYSKYLRHWLELFPKNQILFLQFEKLFQTPDEHMKQVFEHIGLEYQARPYYPQLNSSGGYSEMSPKTRERLQKYFERWNQELYQITEVNYDWS